MRLLSLARANPGARDTLRDAWTAVGAAQREVEDAVLESILRRTRKTYFWMASFYSDRVCRMRRDGRCPLCQTPAREEWFEHPFRRLAPRIRLTCARCGIVQDRAETGPLVRLSPPRVSAEAGGISVRTDLEIEATGETVLAACVNKGGRVIRGADWTESGSEQRLSLPTRLAGERKGSIQLRLVGAKPGIYFVKVFAIANLQLTEASAPFPHFLHLGDDGSDGL